MNQKEDILQWEASIKHWPIKSKAKYAIIDYASNLEENDVPIIFEFRHLAYLLDLKPRVLADIVNRKNSFYREFVIPKRRGGKRLIATPAPVLFEAQKWVLKNILEKIELHESAYAFIKNRDIIKNARIHCENKELLKLDISNFFNNISIRRVISIFKKFGYAPNVSFYLASICTLNDCLPQGAPTSPYISNVIAKRLDKRLAVFCAEFGLSYTRYADDIAISGEKITKSIYKIAADIVSAEGFEINQTKTVIAKENQKKIITGLCIVDGKLRVPKAYKRNVRQEVYYIKKFGLLDHQKRTENLDPLYVDSLLGKLAHWRRVEPDSAFPQEAINWITEYLQDI